MKTTIKSVLIISIFSFQLQAQFENVEISSTAIKDNVYMLEGAGGNIGLLVSEDEALMIDAQFSQLSEKILREIQRITDKPIRFLINTHWHGDHTGGNENINAVGAEIIAHENVKQRLSTTQHMKAFNRTVEAKPETYWPETTFKDKMSLNLGNEEILMTHVHNAHTDGDAFVFILSQNVLHMGDVFFKDRFPFIDLSSGGTVDGYISAVQAALMMVDDDTIIIPGHGELANKSDLEAFLNTIITMRQRVQTAIDDGLSFEEIETLGLDETYESWGTGFISGDKLINTIWTDLTK